ncbi:MAG: DUF2934 domain-containing protein [Verrucomicrobia bacterium]|nr:DUF2934 domain-containing protein [Verrucomicrobiota bacterium]
MTNTIQHENIAKRAYEIYIGSGAQPGRDQENWMQAEAELRSELQQQIAAIAKTVPAPQPSLAATIRQTLKPRGIAPAPATKPAAKRKTASRVKLG